MLKAVRFHHYIYIEESAVTVRSILSAFLTVTLVFTLSLWIGLSATTTALAAPAFAYNVPLQTAVLPGMKGVFTGERPGNLGVKAGTLAGCPATPNCVVSQGGDEQHAIAPILYSSDRATARGHLTDILGVVPRTQIVEQSDDYVLAESESRLMGFVDDTEFYLPKGEKVIHIRAAARLGESDLGVNRRRLEQIRLAFQDLEQRTAAAESAR
jgi:uncharacterized protein (DUF1499 family)